jgi:hypothetical protein
MELNENWRKETWGRFGWYIEDENLVKAFWLPEVEFANPESTVSGNISESTVKILEDKLFYYSASLTPQPHLFSAIASNSLMAFKISEELGGGFMIVLPEGLKYFSTIAIAKDKIKEYRNHLEPYKGVKGWLGIYTFVITFLAPIGFIIYAVFTFLGYEKDLTRYPGFKVITIIGLVLGLIIVILGIRTGLALYGIKPGAVKLAKDYLKLALAANMISLFLPFMVKLPYELEKSRGLTFTIGLIQSLISFSIWYSYFNVSKRVSATYVDS